MLYISVAAPSPTRQHIVLYSISRYVCSAYNPLNTITGRVGLFGFAKNRANSLAQVAQPIDVLFRRKSAPVRARDVYTVDRTDGAVGKRMLPDSDLVKAVHGYASGFYGGRVDGGMGGKGGEGGLGRRMESIWCSLDETALLAVGVLLEEACVDVVGEVGYRAFAERVEEEEVGVGCLQTGLKRKFEELD